jgi:signal transduction histidine kinase
VLLTNASRFETEGTGLGLYLARLTMERLGGQVSYVSEEGKGSTFVVTLPIAGQRIMDSWRHEG